MQMIRKKPLAVRNKTAILIQMHPSPIGILGGTFDPIHLGHIHLAKKMLQLCNLQKILLIPCQQSPMRDPPTASATDRFNMVKLAIAGQSNLFADDHEIKRPGVSYTIETLKFLRQENKNTPLALIMAIDAFNKFDEWHEWQRILEFVHLLVANRPDFQKITNPKIIELLNKQQVTDTQQLQKKMAGLIYLADINPLPISAKKIRALIKKQKDASHLVTPKVWQYICEKHLYKE
jgi:nicotinate-nucleotide adenylyltransferase